MSRSDRILVAAGGGALTLVIAAAVILLAPLEEAPPPDDMGLAFGTPPITAGSTPSVQPPAATVIVVDMAGAVARPGLVTLPAGSRVGEALAAAGGYATDADLDAATASINLAQPLSDGEQIRVPRIGEVTASPSCHRRPRGRRWRRRRPRQPEHCDARAAGGAAGDRPGHGPEDRGGPPGTTVCIAGRRTPAWRHPSRTARGHPGAGDRGLGRWAPRHGRSRPRSSGSLEGSSLTTLVWPRRRRPSDSLAWPRWPPQGWWAGGPAVWPSWPVC